MQSYINQKAIYIESLIAQQKKERFVFILY